ncbi:hypothetical protein BBD42_31005 [Paenibacillus sp. BIHB 4019]|uniref:Replication terminator protein n=1 Tax=Paenibacillus sp. BIHB 4019 TaxID=1870819 RepID=A0A1B2DRT7_9BACL|nr:replication terminator protein [Paenibacillus sp. BIHB 4019]ANY70434.1 hypothetical protein BBD42_31005 [Paenibacillus sp. BIHB 4019]
MNININTLAGGAVAEQIKNELQRIADNVLDPNTSAVANRTLTIKLTIKPDKDRQSAAVDTQVTASLASREGVPSRFVFDYDNQGNGVVAELLTQQDRNQMMMNNAGAVVDGTGAAPEGLKNVVNGVFR